MSVERSALNVERSGAAGPAIDRDNPWPGLATFTEDQGAYFHGRDDEIDDLTQLARLRALVVLFGQSGLGKSSLLQAGVFPRLRANGFCPIYIRLDHAESAPSPTEQIKALVHSETARVGTWTKPNVAKPGETLWEFFHHRDDRLISPGRRPIIPVLVFDQFEELFTLGAAAGGRRNRAIAFMAELAELVENRPSEQLVARLEGSADELEAFDFGRADYRVVITLREDFLPELEGLKTIMPALMANRMRLARMTGTQALQAVVKPGAGLVSEEVACAIVEFVAGARGGSIERLAELNVEPALLSVVCRELNERRRKLGQAQITADLVSGNRREILNDFYERSVADLPGGMRTFVEDHLLTKSGFRDNLALETALEFPGVTQPLIDTLVSRRLLRIEDRAGIQRVELTHDVLADVVRGSRDARQQRIALEEANERERRSLAASARQTRRQRWVISGLATAVAALLVGAFFGLRTQRRAAEQGGHTDVVLGSRLLDEGKLSEGLAYLVRAGRKDPTNELVGPRLLSTLSARSYLFPVGGPLSIPVPAFAAAYTADSRWLFLQGEDDVVRIIDAAAWRVVHELNFGQKVRRGGWTLAEKNSAIFAVVLEDNSIVVGDTATGQPRGRPIRPPARINGRIPEFQLSPDARWVAAGGPSEVWLWDATSGELNATLPVNGYYRQFAFSPDSRKLATTLDFKTTMWSIPEQMTVGAPVESSRGVVLPLFSGDGRRLLVSNYDGVLICDAETGLPVRPLIALSSRANTGMWFTHDGKKVVVSTSNRTVNVIDVETGKDAYPPLLLGGNVSSGDSRLVAGDRVLFANSVDGVQRFWDLDTGKLLAEPTLKQPQYAPAAVTADGKQVVVFSAAGPAYRLRVGGRPAAPLALARTRDDTLFVNLAVGSPTRVVWLSYSAATEIDVATGRKTSWGFTFPEPVTSASRASYGTTLGPKDVVVVTTQSSGLHAWILGESRIASDVALEDSATASSSSGVDSTVQLVAGSLSSSGNGQAGATGLGVWNAKSGRRIATFAVNERVGAGTSTSPVFSPDGQRVVFQTPSDSVLHVGDIGTGKEVLALQLTGKAVITAWRYSPDGRRIVTGDSWGGIQIWEAATGRMVRSTQYHRTALNRFDYSSDRRFYASVSSDGTAQVWDAATDQPVGALLEQSGASARADFSPDNTRIATPSSSGTARVWDVRTGLPVTDQMNTESDQARVAAFSPDGRFVDVHDYGNTPRQFVRLWSVPPSGRGVRTPDWLLTLATICAGHRLTDEGKLVDATATLAQIDDVQRALAAAPADDPYAEWGRWILSESPKRSIAPGFTVTPAEAAKFRTEWLKQEGGPSPLRPDVETKTGKRGKKKR